MVLVGFVPSVDLIKASLKTSGKILNAGGEEYIDWIVGKNSNIENFKEFENIIINSYKTRKILELSSGIPSMVGQNSSNIDSVIATVKDKIDDLSLTHTRNGVTKLGDSLRLAYKVIQQRIKNPGLSGLDTGFLNVNSITGGHSRGDLWIVAARPSMGKTSYILNSMLKTSAPVNGSINSLIFSLEMPKQGIMDRLLSTASEINLTDIRFGSITNREELSKLTDTFATLKTYNIYIDADFHTDPLYLINTIKRYHKDNGIDIVYIDYIQLLVERDDKATHEIGRVSRAMKKIAKDLDIAVCLVSQLNRSLESREDKRPILSDLRQSGNLEEDADVVAFLYRDELYYKDSPSKGTSEFIVRKNRNGPIGTVHLKFEPAITKFEDV
jgi:replicative DNA helicase